MKLAQGFMAAYAGDIIITVFAVVVTVASFISEPAEIYLFPRLSSSLILFFCILNMAFNIRRQRQSPPLSMSLLRRLLPGMAIMVVYVAAAELLGFYLSSVAAFFLLSWCYAGKNSRWWHIVLATAFMLLFVYGLFGILLQVQTPDPFWVD